MEDGYIPECILDCKKDSIGNNHYLVKWLNYGMRFNTWEPESKTMMHQIANYVSVYCAVV